MKESKPETKPSQKRKENNKQINLRECRGVDGGGAFGWG